MYVYEKHLLIKIFQLLHIKLTIDIFFSNIPSYSLVLVFVDLFVIFFDAVKKYTNKYYFLNFKNYFKLVFS